MFVRVASHQQICLKQLQLTCKHICSCGVEPAGVFVTLASDQKLCPLCSHPTNGLVSTVAPDHQACMLQLQMNSSHVFISCILSACISVTVSYYSYRHPCMFHLHPTISHVCSSCIRSFAMSLTVTSNQQPCLLNLHLQARMSIRLHWTSIHICYSNIRPSVLSVALAPYQYSSNGCYNCSFTQAAAMSLSYTQPVVILMCFMLIHCTDCCFPPISK